MRRIKEDAEVLSKLQIDAAEAAYPKKKYRAIIKCGVGGDIEKCADFLAFDRGVATARLEILEQIF